MLSITQCSRVRTIRKVWNVEENDLRSGDIEKMRDVARFVEKVELMLEPSIGQKIKWQS